VPYVQSHALLVVDWLGDIEIKSSKMLDAFT
jgi:hypothetical protein